MTFEIRTYHITDLSSIYRICLHTGYNGGDATPFLKDPDLIGHIFAAPYAFFEPNLCFILALDSKPCGYVLGTRNSATFHEECEKKWLPELRKRYPLPRKNNKSLEFSFIQYMHQNQIVPKELEDYPAHLHIDILPIAQGKGYGRKLIENFLRQLQNQHVRGVHLIVSKNNHNAIEFYRQIGFKELIDMGESLAFGQEL